MFERQQPKNDQEVFGSARKLPRHIRYGPELNASKNQPGQRTQGGGKIQILFSQQMRLFIRYILFLHLKGLFSKVTHSAPLFLCSCV